MQRLGAGLARGAGWFALLVAGVLVLVAILGFVLRPAGTTPPVMSDALGPESGETVASYIERAARTLAGEPGDPGSAGADRWALVSLDEVLTATGAGEIADAAGIGRISQVEIYAPVADVAMPVLPAAVAAPGSDDAGQSGPLGRAVLSGVTNSQYMLDHPGAGVAAAGTADGGGAPSAGDARMRAQIDYTAGEALAGRRVVAGFIAHAGDEALDALARQPGVRAVEALPVDAVWGRFAVRPLLPEQRVAATPLRDTGEVPAPAPRVPAR